MTDESGKGWLFARFDEIEPTPCPCGLSRRAFRVPGNEAASLHQVEISEDALPHFHKKTTEIYYILEGEGFLELDGEKVAVSPGVSVLIPPGTMHRALGRLKILNIAVPTFDPDDEWFDERED